MPIARPGRSELLELARTEIEAHLPGSDAHLRRSFLDVFARIQSAQVHSFYGFTEFHTRQAFPQLAEGEYLRRHAALYGVPELPAEFARGPIMISGTVGLGVEQDTKLRRADGREYLTLATSTLGGGGTATVDVIAVEAGLDGNSAAGTALTFVSPVPGINVSAVVTVDTISGGADVESDESLRARVLARIQHPPAGGTIYDYQARAKLYGGVTDVFVHPQQYGAGTVGVAPLFYDREDPIPTGSDVTGVQALLTDPAWKPACATVTTYALDPEPVDFEIEDLTPDTSAVRGAVIAELTALFRRAATPGGVIFISQIREAISAAAGEVDYTLVIPSANVDLAGNLTKISTVGSFSWS